MQGIDATIDDVPLGGSRDNRQVLLKMVPGAVALAVVGCVGVWVVHSRQTAAPDIPDIVVVLPAANPPAAPAAEAAANPFGAIIIDPSFLAEMKSASPNEDRSTLASLEAAPPAPPASTPLPDTIPLPPKR